MGQVGTQIAHPSTKIPNFQKLDSDHISDCKLIQGQKKTDGLICNENMIIKHNNMNASTTYNVLNKQPAALFVRDGKLIQDTVATATTTSNKLNRDGRSISNF